MPLGPNNSPVWMIVGRELCSNQITVTFNKSVIFFLRHRNKKNKQIFLAICLFDNNAFPTVKKKKRKGKKEEKELNIFPLKFLLRKNK